MSRNSIYTILAFAVLALSAIPVGSAVFLLGFIGGDSPCVMCWEQRTGMALIALIGLFVLRYGPRPRYLGLSVLVGAYGIFMGLRHTGMHAARDIGQGFSVEIWGAHTYTWALFIFWVCVVTMGFLLTIMKEGELAVGMRSFRPAEKAAIGIFMAVIAGNILQAFASTGPPPFMGQGDPVRFSFNPKHWVWSLEEWSSVPISLRGRWAATKPDLSALPVDPGSSPLADLQPLVPRKRDRIGVTLGGPVTDIAHDAATDRFLVTTHNGVYLLDGSMTRILRYAIVDRGYSVDLGRFAGAAFLDSHTVMALGENKSYVVLHESEGVDAEKNYRFFLESFDAFTELSRARLGTVRARMMYVMSLAYDPATSSILTVTVPNNTVRRLVVSRFDRRDLALSEEFVPEIAPESGLKLNGDKRSLDELYVTGAAVAEGRLYAISAAYSTLVIIDLSRHSVVGARAIVGLIRPTGMAIRGGEIYIVSAEGDVYVTGRPPGR
jgi:disulfide bond formation protein DsbB